MRIGVRFSPRTSGGGRAFIERLTVALRASPGVDRVPIFLMGAGEVPGLADVVRVAVPGGSLGRKAWGSRALEQAAASHPVDVLICPGTETSVLRGVPTLMWPLTVAPLEHEARRALGATPRQEVRWALLEAALRAATRKADAFVFSSWHAQALYSTRVSGVAGKPRVVLPPSATLTSAHGTHQAGPSGSYALFVSHLYPYKMVVEMVEAYARAREQGVTHDLVIVGGHPHEQYSRLVAETVSRFGLTECVHVVGPTYGSQLRNWYEQASAFVFPSLSENAGSYALIDAYVSGLPVLSSSLSSMPEACQDAAMYFDPRSPGALAELMVRVLPDAEELARLGEASRRRATLYPTWEDTATGLVAFCRSLGVGES